MNIFEFEDYKLFLLSRLKTMPNHGHGELKKIAVALRTHTTRISHIFRGAVHLTAEQACDLAKHLGLSELETEYLLGLVQRERAGTEPLRLVFTKQLSTLRAKSKQLVHRVEKDHVLTEQEKATFYSNWHYAGIQLATLIPELQTLDALARRFDLPRERIRQIVDFLVTTGLCTEREGRLSITPVLTHLEAVSPLVSRHHANWRIKAMQRHEKLGPGEVSYTAPMALSRKDQAAVRELAMAFIQRVLKLVKESEPNEALCCLGLDWLEF